MPLRHLVTWASTLSCAFTEPGLHITIPRRISSLFTPLTNAPNWSPACASSRIWWNISMPIVINVTITTFTDILRHMAIMVTMIMVRWDVVTSHTTWCHIQEDLIFSHPHKSPKSSSHHHHHHHHQHHHCCCHHHYCHHHTTPAFCISHQAAGPSGHVVKVVGLQPLACWDRGFESHWGHGCLSVVSVVFSGRGLCNELLTHPEESYRLWCIVVWSRKTNSRMRRPRPTRGLSCQEKKQPSSVSTMSKLQPK